jgi:hypothetical protein
MNYEEAIADFKTKEVIEDAMLLSGKDDQAERFRRLVVSWQKINISTADKRGAAPENECDRWNWLWAHIKYDVYALAAISSVPKSRVDILLQTLRGNRVIYPDGTVSAYATKIIRQLMKSQLNL